MPDADRPPPGTGLVVIVLAAGLAVTAWMQTHRVRVPGPDAVVAAGERVWPDMRLDVNRATAPELNVLPGLGPRLAERIVDDRRRHGPFESIDAVQRVPGVGPKLVERIRPHAVAEP